MKYIYELCYRAESEHAERGSCSMRVCNRERCDSWLQEGEIREVATESAFELNPREKNNSDVWRWRGRAF